MHKPRFKSGFQLLSVFVVRSFDKIRYYTPLCALVITVTNSNCMAKIVKYECK